MYFQYRQLSGQLFAITSFNGTATVTTLPHPSVDVWHRYEIEYTPTEAKFYFNGTLLVTHTTDIPPLTTVFASIRRNAVNSTAGILIDKIKLTKI